MKDLQEEILHILHKAQEDGRTVAELRDLGDLGHHGSVSGALSMLHKDEQIARLRAARGGCKVYVALPYVADRETEQQGRPGLRDRKSRGARPLPGIRPDVPPPPSVMRTLSPEEQEEIIARCKRSSPPPNDKQVLGKLTGSSAVKTRAKRASSRTYSEKVTRQLAAKKAKREASGGGGGNS